MHGDTMVRSIIEEPVQSREPGLFPTALLVSVQLLLVVAVGRCGRGAGRGILIATSSLRFFYNVGWLTPT